MEGGHKARYVKTENKVGMNCVTPHKPYEAKFTHPKHFIFNDDVGAKRYASMLFNGWTECDAEGNEIAATLSLLA